MENFNRIIRAKHTFFDLVKREIDHAEQTGDLDWPVVGNRQRAVLGIFYGPRLICPETDGRFAAIYDLLDLYECKDAKVWNVLVKSHCVLNSGCFDDRIRKAAYYDFDDSIKINPCQNALNRADIRGLRFLLQSGVPYLGRMSQRKSLCIFPQVYFPDETFEEVRTKIYYPTLEEERRALVVERTLDIFMSYLRGPCYNGSCYEELGLDKVPGMTVQMSSTGNYFPVFKGSIEDARSQVPEKFRRDIGDWKFHFNYIRCYRMVFNTIPEPIVTYLEVSDAPDLEIHEFSRVFQEFRKIFPECTGPSIPRSLKHLSKCQLRENIRMSHLFPESISFSEAVHAITEALPKPLQDYVLDIDDSRIHN